jgi:hypothetical protein
LAEKKCLFENWWHQHEKSCRNDAVESKNEDKLLEESLAGINCRHPLQVSEEMNLKPALKLKKRSSDSRFQYTAQVIDVA